MAKYAVQFSCFECGGVHPFGISIELKDGPASRASIGDAYAGKELPSQIIALKRNLADCPVTGKVTSQKHNNQVFLVPA
jgi:hypothetical protein